VSNKYHPPNDLRDIKSWKNKNRTKNKNLRNKNLTNDFSYEHVANLKTNDFSFEHVANLKTEPFNEDVNAVLTEDENATSDANATSDVNAILTEDENAILNFDRELEELENVGEADFLRVSDMENEISDLSDWDDEDDEDGDDDDDDDFRIVGRMLPKTASSSCPTCNKSFVNAKGKLRAGVSRRMDAGDRDPIGNHSLRCSKREIKKLLIPCRLCLTLVVANRVCRLKHYRKHHPETILTCPVNGCGTRLVDDTSDFQFHIRRNHTDNNPAPAPVFVSDGYQVFERAALDIEGWSDELQAS